MDAGLSALVRDAEQFRSSSDGLRDGRKFLAVDAPQVGRASGVGFGRGFEASLVGAGDQQAVISLEDAALLFLEAAGQQGGGRLAHHDARSTAGVEKEEGGVLQAD